jgi:hypothetical protein
MDFLRNILKEQPKDWIEYAIVGDVEAQVNSMQGEEWAQILGLTHIFEAITEGKQAGPEVKEHE